MNLDKCAALVTGASRGIGRAIALELASNGADVVINYHKNVELASEVVDEVKALGCDAFAVKADVSSQRLVKDMIDKTVEEFGSIDILVNNAGIIKREPFEDITIDDWDRVMNINLRGPFLCCRYAGKHMIEQRRGNIINISSIAALNPEIYMGAYSVTKAGLKMLTELLAVEWGKYNIRVNSVCPGPVNTPLIRQAFDSERLLETRVNGIPTGRMSEPEGVAKVVAFLASEESSNLTGEHIVIDGGSSRSMYYLLDRMSEIAGNS
ncbi:MAG: SDR family NAD(P)-dependent oxidoreductase [Candidatus Bathyarchaeia archaeon]